MEAAAHDTDATGDGASFERLGFALVDVLDDEALAALRAVAEALAIAPVRGFYPSIAHPDAAHRAAVDAAIRRTVWPVLGRVIPTHRLAFANFVTKSAATPESAVPLHLDWSFVDEDRHRSLGFWCPLVDVDAANGALQVVPGSHRLPIGLRGAGTAFPYPELERELRARWLVTVPMRAGQALVMDHRLMHASPSNRSAGARTAAAGVLVPTAAPLRYHHVPDPTRPNVLEVFEVDDAFYLRHAPGARPVDAARIGVVSAVPAPLDVEDLARLLPTVTRRA